MMETTVPVDAPQFELFSWEVWRDPYPFFATLRERHPIFKHPITPFWIVSRYDDVNEILKNPTTFSSRFPGNFDRKLNGTDAPEHTAMRRRLSPSAARQSVAVLEKTVEAHAHSLMDAFVGAGRCEFVAEFAQPLPFRVMAAWLGLDPSLYETCVTEVFPFLMAEPLLDGQGEPLVDQMELEQRYVTLLSSEVEAFEASQRTGLLPGLLQPSGTAPPLEQDTVVQLAKILLFAGQKTSACALANSMWILLGNRQVLDALRRNTSLVAKFVEESFRLESPVQSLFRITTAETELSGTTFPAFAFIRTLIGSANRDESRIPDADLIRLDRAEKTHLGLGFGPHLCLGAHLARVILRTALTALLDRLHELECENALDEVERFRSPNFRGIKQLPIRFRAA